MLNKTKFNGDDKMPEVILNGPHGRIECRYHRGASSDSPIALILHPEPNQWKYE